MEAGIIKLKIKAPQPDRVKQKKIPSSAFRFFINTLVCVCLANTGIIHAAPMPDQKITDTGSGDNKQEQKHGDGMLTLNFQSIPVRSALQLLAQFAGINIVVSESVQGGISLHLKDLPWQQALAVILQAGGLADRVMGNIHIIAPAAEIVRQEKDGLQAAEQLQQLEPLQSVLIPVNYGKAADMAAMLKGTSPSLISSRGSISFDARTNMLWVQDTSEKLSAIKSLVHGLDLPERQVLIEARVVNIDKFSEQELGIRWGVSGPDDNLTGTLEGASQTANATAVAAVPLSQRLNVDLPAASVGMAGGSASIGIALAKLSDGVLLDLELSALQTSGEAHIMASPRLITANQKETLIESGEEIPFQEATSSGATSVSFKKAVLSLRVTPHITPDNRIILDLKVNQDKRGAEVLSGIPTIDTREIQTQVLVNNGQTIVLGGIFQNADSNNVERVPFLGNIPILGYLFRHTGKVHRQTELLIFVTPRVLQQ